MARLPNPYYREPADPSASIGQSLGRALFGDPAAAAKQADQASQQAQRQAAADEATAHARYYGTQADGQDISNTANTGLPHLFASMYAPPPAPMVAPTIDPTPTWTPGVAHQRTQPAVNQDDAAPAPSLLWTPGPAPLTSPSQGDAAAPPIVASAPASLLPPGAFDPPAAPSAPAPVSSDPNVAFHQGLPALLAALAQGGQGANADRLVRSLAAFGGGGDAMQRAALIAGGDSPSKDFAGTAERADQIAATAAAADRGQAVAVAGVNHASDLPVARIQAASAGNVATINNRDNIPVAHINAQGKIDVEGVKSGENSLGDMIGSLYPGARITSENRSQAEQDALIASGATKATHSYHVPGNGGVAIDMPAIPGQTLGQVVANLTAHGQTILPGTKVEQGGPNDGTGPHWHIAVADTGGKAAARPRTINMKALNDEVTKRFTNPNTGVTDLPVGSVLTAVRERAAALYQQNGNPVSAVAQAVRERQAMARTARIAQATQTPRQAPDGNWYIVQGRHADGSPAYARVENR